MDGRRARRPRNEEHIGDDEVPSSVPPVNLEALVKSLPCRSVRFSTMGLLGDPT